MTRTSRVSGFLVPGSRSGKIFDGRARFPIWDTDNNLLFFPRESGGNNNLYHATFDAYYHDLSVTTSIDGYIRAVAWLGNQ